MLEPVEADHADDLWRLHRDEGIAEWCGGRWNRQRARAEARTLAAGWERHGVGKWLAYDRHTHMLVGRGGLSRATVDGAGVVEVGWAVHQRLWGQGYATEIGRAALDVAFTDLGLAEVVAFTEVHNVRSRAVMERLGMAYRRDIRRPGLVEGGDDVRPTAPFALYALAAP